MQPVKGGKNLPDPGIHSLPYISALPKFFLFLEILIEIEIEIEIETEMVENTDGQACVSIRQ